MQMYQVVDTESPGIPALESFHLTVEEAEDRIARSSRHDRVNGERPGKDYLAIKIVERDSQPCASCGGESENSAEKYPKYPYCRNCHYTGSAAEHQQMNEIYPFRKGLDGADVSVWHTGGGCFMLTATWEDDEFYYGMTEGEASLPEDWDEGWGILVRYPKDDNHPEYDGVLLLESDPPRYDGGPGISRKKIIAAIKKDRRARGK